MLIFRLCQIFFFLAACALAVCAHADYGQMRLEGASLWLAFALSVAYGLIVDVALIARIFRYRAILVVGLIFGLLLIVLLLAQAASPSELAALDKGALGGASMVVMLVTSVVLLPFIVIAPIAQYRALRDERPWPGWITAWMVLQVALVPAFFVLASMEDKFQEQEYAAGLAVGREASAGGFGVILERADQQRDRIWGTGWPTPWKPEPPSGNHLRRSRWFAGLAKGIDGSAPIAANEPLSELDRTALLTLVERYFFWYAALNVRTKLIWDALEPGDFARQLAPYGLNERGVVSEEIIPLLLVRLEKDGGARLCPDGQMMDADRAILKELVLAKARFYQEARERDLKTAEEEKKLDAEMAAAPAQYRLPYEAAQALKNRYGGRDSKLPDWSDYPQRVEQLCRGPE